jgi:CHAT domain-containing protein
VLRQKTYVWVIGPHIFKPYVLPWGREELARSIDKAAPAWLEGGKDRWRPYLDDLGRLSGQLLGRLAGELSARRLIFITTGPLQEVPFAALLTVENASEDPLPFLVRDHEIAYLPSAAVFRELRKSRPAKAGRPLLAAVAVSEFPAQTHLQPLPKAREEAEAISRLARPLGQVVELFDPAPQIESLRSPAVREARILHLATHALVDRDVSSRSSIAFAGPGNGLLYAPDVYELRLHADLVVLSACETGIGPDVTGEGLISLTRGFFYAGAPRVLASLWKINDKATFELMRGFYQNLLLERRSPAAALRAAQIAMLKEGRWTAPKYWAGVTLQGDWSPMDPTIP